MITVTDLQAGILVITRASELLKKAKGLVDKTQDVEIKDIIVELRSSLVDTKDLLVSTKSELTSLKEENNSLKEIIQKLEEEKNEQNQPTLKDGLYYKPNGDGGFCTNCYDVQGKFIRVVETAKKIASLAGKHKCPSCKTYYQ